MLNRLTHVRNVYHNLQHVVRSYVEKKRDMCIITERALALKRCAATKPNPSQALQEQGQSVQEQMTIQILTLEYRVGASNAIKDMPQL